MIFFIFLTSSIYLLITLKSSKENKISPWLEGNIKVKNDKFFKYQFIGSIIIFIFIISISVFLKKSNLDNIYFLFVVLIFSVLNYLVKYMAIKKGYLLKKE